MNMIFRAVKEEDLDAIYLLSAQSGVGITTLPKDKVFLKDRIKFAVDSFKQDISKPHHEYYLFVLEDLATGSIAGTAAVLSKTGVDAPFYSYRWVQEERENLTFSIQSLHEYLTLSYENAGSSEMCTLYLSPEYRQHGNGVLLSLARFLFIFNYPERFTADIIAELRGVSDENGHSPFWNAVGEHFFHMSFAEADQLTMMSNKGFISDLIPHHPIYLNLLNPTAKSVISTPHPASLPAMRILLREGFENNGTVDIFDAGPTLKTQTKNIRTIRNALKMCLCTVENLAQSSRMLLSNTQLDFRATVDFVSYDLNQKTCYLTAHVASKLNAIDGDIISMSEI